MAELMVRQVVKLTLSLTLALFALTCATLRASATQAVAGERPRAVIDLSGVDTFLELTALLEQDKEPTPELWDRLFSTPGYAVLIKREFGRDFFIDRFKLAFMPSKKSNLEAQMKKDTGFWAQFLPHYLRAKQMRKDVERLAAEMRTAEFAEEAINRARAFLPELHRDERP